ncbi:hypothetical protein LIA77_11739 [Sarocladium implicatum]|nr:hypothetical protein LIA77_11739 [Sarocladium implicatum]
MTNLLTVPTEVIDLISGSFCTCQLCNSSDEARVYQETRRTLCALSATCRILRHLVQPVLYHRVHPFHGQVEFARTLVDSPRLAACVRELYYPIGAYEDRAKRLLYPSVNKHAYTKPGWFEVVDVDTIFSRLVSEQPGGFYDEEGQETGRGQIR